MSTSTLPAPEPIEAAATRPWLNLSLAQQAVWLDARLSDASDYQLGGWARVPHVLDEDMVRQTIALVMARHDGLRLRVDDELPRQWLDTTADPPLTIFDLPSSQDDPETAFHTYVAQTFASPLPLGDAPLFRVHLVRASGVSFLLWRFHHLIADSASVAITQQLWANAFEVLASDSPQELAPRSSYLNILASDAAYVASSGYDQDLAYWVDRFDPLPPPLIADMEHRRHSPREVPPATLRLEGATLAALQDAAKAAGTSASRALFALFTLALARRYGRWELISGVALHRRDASSRFTLGMLAGVIGVRCHFEPYWSIEEGVQAFNEQLDADLRHQRMPLDIVARNLDLAASGRVGLFEAAMSYMPAQRDAVSARGITGGAVSTREASPISLHIDEAPDHTLHLQVAVNAAFLDPAEAPTLLNLLQAAMEAFVSAPETRLECLATLTTAERNQLEAWNETAAPFPKGTLEALFAAQAAATPDHVAIVSPDGETMTYADLETRSTALARQLAGSGVQPSKTVGVQMPRSPETIIALLAILKAGAVYLPLDPAYPADRLAFMVKDASAVQVLTSIAIEAAEADLPDPASLADPARRAYIIYTSGTTGLPKGVAVPHAAAVNLAYGRRVAHDPIGPGDRILAAISVGFDVSIGQLLLPLLSGATIVIAPELRTLAATDLWSLLVRQQVTHINSVPSFLDSILDAAPVPSTLALKRLMLGGEALTGRLIERLQHALPAVEVVNMYGPTETCIDATFHVATPADVQKATLPIGRPLPNYQGYVLNAQMELCGIGVTGELFLGGDGLAEGYLNLPELTASRFIPSPFHPGTRLYRTGDRARWSASGEIEFLGRMDQQVKIRGFRVEPAEVAAVLLKHASVAQAVVLPAPGPSGLRLLAYIVPSGTLDIADLRAHAASQLPHYMVPSAFVTLRALPLTQNGKLDVKALPRPEMGATAFVDPRTPTETAVAAAFAEVLGLDRCGATSHFFELGGHSLLAATLTSRLRALGVKLALRAVFDAPTVEGLARRIDLQLHDTSAAERIVTQPRPDAIPLSLVQERLWFLDRLEGDGTYNIPVAVGMRGRLDLPSIELALRRIVERHEILRTGLVLSNGKPTQVIVPHPKNFITRVDVSDMPDPDAAVRAALARLAATQLDLAAGEPLAVQLFTLAPDRHVMGAVVHHAAFDGWSANLFLVELQRLYTAFLEGQTDPLPPLALQYADFALWQRSRDYSPGRAFWLEALAGAPAFSQLPPTLPANGDSKRLAAGVRFDLDAVRYGALMRLARQHNASLFFVLHAALALHLARAAGQDDIVIGTVVANRERSEVEPLIGCFVNTLPLRTRILPGDTFGTLLERVKNSDLSAFAHQDYPFDEIVKLLPSSVNTRSSSSTPLFQVLLVLQNTPTAALTLPGLTLELLAVSPLTAQFDLAFDFSVVDGTLSGSLQYAANRYDRQAIEGFAKGLVELLDSVATDADQPAGLTLTAPPAAPAVIVEGVVSREFFLPDGPAEERLAALWMELLGVDRVSRNDNFFELGGHSLLTIALIDRLAQQGLRLDIRTLFDQPTLSGMASQIAEAPLPQTAAASIPPGTTALTPAHFPLTTLTQPQIDGIVATLPGGPANVQDIYPLAPLQEGILFQHLLAPLADPYLAPFLLAFDTLASRDSFLAALHCVVARHDVLRTAILWSQADRPLQIVLREASVPVTVFPGTEATESQLIEAYLDGKFRLSLDTAPMMRAVLATDSTQQRWFVFLLTHHLVLDHISMEIVVRELQALMRDSAAGLPQPVPYRNFVAHTLADPQRSAGGDFFERLLGDFTKPTALFGLHTLPLGETNMREGRLRLGQYLADRVRSRAATLGISPASLFHLAWAIVLGHVSASRDVVFGTVLLGRMNSGAQAAQAVGMFINTLPLRVSLNTTAAAAALATHRLLLQLLLHEHAPLAMVQRASGIRSALPLITSLFNFRHSPEAADAAPWPGVSMLFAQERTNYPVAMAVDDTGGDFLLTAITASIVDPDLLCGFLEATVANLLAQLEDAPDAPLGQLPALPAVTPALPPAIVSVPPVPSTFEAPRTPAEAAIQAIWQRLLGLPAIGIHDDFFYVGGDSLTAMRLLSAVHSVLGVDLPMRALLEAPTIAGMAAMLIAPSGTQAEGKGRLVRLQPEGSRPPLFCIHPAGGYVFCYLPLARELGRLLDNSTPLYGLQATGIDGDEKLPASIEEAATSAVEAIRQHQPHGPYQLLGMSSGGLIAFEMARQLRSANQSVSLLAMLDTAVPFPERPPMSGESLLLAMAAELGCRDLLETTPAPASLAELVAAAQAANRLPEGFALVHAERIARVFANTVALHDRYRPIATEDPVLLLRATHRLHPGDALPDWSALIPSNSQIVDFDCDHAGLVSRQFAPEIAPWIAPFLCKVTIY